MKREGLTKKQHTYYHSVFYFVSARCPFCGQPFCHSCNFFLSVVA